MGFKVNYRGDYTMLHSYEYKCTSCDETHILRHKIKELDEPHACPCCGGRLKRHITTVPALDADFHDDCKSFNIGWDR